MGKATELGELQLAILRVLWKKKEASAADVHAALGGRRDLAITTVSTILTRLERRGIVSHRTVGRTFVYRPTITEASVRSSMLRSLVDSMFSRDPTAVVSQLPAADSTIAASTISIGSLVATITAASTSPIKVTQAARCSPTGRRRFGSS